MKIHHLFYKRAKALMSTAAVAASLTVAALPQARAEVVKIKVGHLVSLDMAPLFVAKESGCFAKNDLDVQLVFFANPGDNNAALVGGAIDISMNPFTLPFFAANGGVPIRVVAAAGGWGVMEVVAQGHLAIGSPSELKAYVQSHDVPLKVATLQGDTLELVLTRSFDQAGIDRSKVKFIYFNDLLAMVEAFRSGQVDLLSHIKPYTTDLVVTKNAKLVTDEAKVWSLHSPNAVVSVLDKTLNNRRPMVHAYLESLVCAAKLINEDPQKAVGLLSKGNYYRVPQKVLLQAFTSAPAPISFQPDVDVIQGVVNDLSKLGYIKGNTKAADIFRLDEIISIER